MLTTFINREEDARSCGLSFHISVPIIHYSCHITEAKGEVGIP